MGPEAEEVREQLRALDAIDTGREVYRSARPTTPSMC